MAFTVQRRDNGHSKRCASQSATKASPAATSSLSPPSSVPSEVVNIVVDKIEGGAIYSKDGQKFEITSTTKVINNTPSRNKNENSRTGFRKRQPGDSDPEMKRLFRHASDNLRSSSMKRALVIVMLFSFFSLAFLPGDACGSAMQQFALSSVHCQQCQTQHTHNP